MNIINDMLDDVSQARAVLHLDKASRETHYSREQFVSEVSAVARALTALEIGPGSTVMILAASGVPALVAICATMAVGATAVPVHPGSGDDVLKQIVASSKPALVFIAKHEQQLFIERQGNHCKHFILLSGIGAVSVLHGSAPVYFDVVAEKNLSAKPFRPICCPPNSLALIIHSSGSQGIPKGIQYSHARLRRFFCYHNFLYAQFMASSESPESYPPLLCTLPLSHLAGLAIAMMSLMTRRPIVMLDQFIPQQYFAIAQREQADMLMLIPAMYGKLIQEARLQGGALPCLRFCLTVGEACPVALAEQVESVLGGKLVVGYGMSECQSGLGYSREELSSARVRQDSCGRHLYGELRLMDEMGKEDPYDGELWVKNASVEACYTDDDMNTSRFSSGWYKTGDRFHRCKEGYFYHRGRIDDMFVHNGKNIYPAEVEKIFRAYPGVLACCLAPVESHTGHKVPALLVQSTTRLDVEAMLSFYIEHGAPHTIPGLILHTETLPGLNNGKLNRQQCRQQLQAAYMEKQTTLVT